MERHGYVTPLRLADERARDQLDLGLPVRVDVLEHRRVVRRAALRREDVHLPRVVVQLDSRGCSDGLALVDEAVHEVAEVARLRLLREVEVVRKPGQRRRRVDRCVEDELRPLRRPEIRERLGLQPRRDDRARRCPARRRTASPRTGPSHVSVSRMYSTCVSEWRVPLMNVTPETIGHAPCARTTSSAPIPLSTVTIVASGKRPSSARTAALEARRLRRDDRDVERRELVRIVRRGDLRQVLASCRSPEGRPRSAPPRVRGVA